MYIPNEEAMAVIDYMIKENKKSIEIRKMICDGNDEMKELLIKPIEDDIAKLNELKKSLTFEP